MFTSVTQLRRMMRKMERPPVNLLTDANVRVIMDVQPAHSSDTRWDAFVSASRRLYLRVKPQPKDGVIGRAEWFDLGPLH